MSVAGVVARTNPIQPINLFNHRLKGSLFRVASLLTEPMCQAQELYQRIQIVEKVHTHAAKVEIWARKWLLMVGMFGYAAVAMVTILPGAALRGLAAFIEKEPFLYLRGEALSKTSPDTQTFTLFSWNICGIVGGLPIAHGGVTPWRERLDRIADRILEKDSDVVCLYEVFDTEMGYALYEKLKKKYAHFYFNMRRDDVASNAVGLSSGLFVACKYEIKNPKFTSFPKETLVGTTKYASKGVFGFDICDHKKTGTTDLGRIFTAHLQQSSEPCFPTPEEERCRALEMDIIAKEFAEDETRTGKNRTRILTGDLNMDDREVNGSHWRCQLMKGDSFTSPYYTWGGDTFCARLRGGRVSGPLNLDHTFIQNGMMRTSWVSAFFNAHKYTPKALSDHSGLLSEISPIIL